MIEKKVHGEAKIHTAILIFLGVGFLAALVIGVIEHRRMTPREREEVKAESQLW